MIYSFRTFAWDVPADFLPDKIWLPWSRNNVNPEWVISLVISSAISYLAVFAVLALMISWIMYMISAWDDEKAKKAKKWIMWSLAWVLLSVSALWIIKMINNITI